MITSQDVQSHEDILKIHFQTRYNKSYSHLHAYFHIKIFHISIDILINSIIIFYIVVVQLTVLEWFNILWSTVNLDIDQLWYSSLIVVLRHTKK